MIDIRKLKELVRLMVQNDLSELDLRDAEEQVTLRRPSANAPTQVYAAAPPPPAVQPAPEQPAPSAAAAPAVAADPSDDLPRIESPMVGTFFSAPNPNSPAFVKVGDHVDIDTTVCIIEAMKIFNEIKAETKGTIQKVLIENGQSVEFGQPMFIVKPD